MTLRLNAIIVVVLFVLLSVQALSQHVNAYCRVTGITNTTLFVSDALENAHNFDDAHQVILIQMQANVIGNTTNSAAFGTIGSIGPAGLYEVLEVESVTRSAGNLIEIEVKSTPEVSYDFSDNARVQLVTFPQIGNPDFTTNSLITCPEWNGERGGIVAFQVTGTLELNHNIHADGKGFRGGARSQNHGAETNCDYTVYRSNSSNHAEKGEGIFRRTVNNQRYSRAPLVSGGGGGSSHNGGGGGGGNFTTGGNGGAGYNSTATGCNPNTSGMGGLQLSDYIEPNRVFMGGGGGGGQQNNSVSTDGERGGGIVFIKAERLTTPDDICDLRISADGLSAVTAGNDGAGGGGAGGSIVFQVWEFEVDENCPLTIRSNGGNGGDVNSVTHAGGGGGGQGCVVFPLDQPTENIQTFTLNGAGGCDNSSCTQAAEPGQGPNNIGILTGSPSLLNALAIDLTAGKEASKVLLEWMVTEASTNDAVPTRIERSDNLNDWEVIRRDYSYPRHRHQGNDTPGAGTWYYRAAADDGSDVVSHVRAVEIGFDGPLVRTYFPNPAQEVAYIRFNGSISGRCRVIAPDGRTVQDHELFSDNQLVLDLTQIASGMYIIEVHVGDRREMLRLKVN